MAEHAGLETTQHHGLSRTGLRRVLVVLCGTEVISWGVLFYAFPVLAVPIAVDTGWSVPTVTAAFSASQITAALAGIPVGRLLDRVGPRPVMTTGSVLAVPAVLAIATAASPAMFFVGWVAAGVAMAAVLYQPAFAALTVWWGDRRVTALTALTLVAGFASTVFAPLTAALVGRFDWRETYLILAVVLAATTIPAHAFGLRGGWPRSAPSSRTSTHSSQASQVARSRPFLLLTVAMMLAGFAIYAVVVNQVPLLTERGLSANTAALALGLSGAGQVCGRLGFHRLTVATTVRTRTLLVLGAGAGTTALLAVVPGPAALLVAVAVLAGAARGLFTLLQATAVTDRWGATHYGRLNGLITAPSMIAVAIAPWAGAALAHAFGSYPAVFAVLAAVAALGAVLSVFASAATSPSERLTPGS